MKVAEICKAIGELSALDFIETELAIKDDMTVGRGDPAINDVNLHILHTIKLLYLQINNAKDLKKKKK